MITDNRTMELIVASIALFTSVVLRLHSPSLVGATLGICDVFLIYFSTSRLTNSKHIPLVSMILLAILPWHIQLNFHSPNATFVLTILLMLISLISNQLLSYSKGLLVSSLVVFIVGVLISVFFLIPRGISFQVIQNRTLLSPVVPKLIRVMFENKFIESYRYRERILFENLDFGNLFFTGHPRERSGITETPKLFAWLLPFIMLGIIRTNRQLKLLMFSLIIFSLTLTIVIPLRGVSENFISVLSLVFFSSIGISQLM